jgi:hypothetical protein
MCMNCGCGDIEDRHGSPENITLGDVRRAADVNAQDMQTTVSHLQASMDRVARSGPSASSTFRGGAGGTGTAAGDSTAVGWGAGGGTAVTRTEDARDH